MFKVVLACHKADGDAAEGGQDESARKKRIWRVVNPTYDLGGGRVRVVARYAL